MLTYEHLLAKIYDDEKIELVLEALGCHSIHWEQGGSLIVAGKPDGDNRRSVQVRNEPELKAVIRTSGICGDLFDIVRELCGFEFISQAREYLMSTCGYSGDTEYSEPPLAWLNKIKRQRKHYNLEYEMTILENDILNQFLYGDIAQFNSDGISTNTLEYFKVGYDVITKRITIPIYTKDGYLCGVKGRATTKEDEENWKFFFLYRCDQSKTIYNYHRVKKYHETVSVKEVKVFESEKSPMQMHELGIYDAVGIGSSNISRHQLKLLEDLNCDIVLCFDEGLDLEIATAPFFNYFKNKRNVWVVVDDGTMPRKSSPSDNGIEMWNRLNENRILLCKGE